MQSVEGHEADSESMQHASSLPTCWTLGEAGPSGSSTVVVEMRGQGSCLTRGDYCWGPSAKTSYHRHDKGDYTNAIVWGNHSSKSKCHLPV